MTEEEQKEEAITEKDLHFLEMARMKKMLAQSQLETVDQAYQNAVLQVSVKYSLIDKDIINEQGKIVRGAQK